ncbi:unnamed protein product [Withania somnifera]
MGIKKWCFCMMNWKSNKTKQESYKASPKGRVPRYLKPSQKSRDFNTMAAYGHTAHVNHGDGVANNHGNNDVGAPFAAIIATDMDGGGE